MVQINLFWFLYWSVYILFKAPYDTHLWKMVYSFCVKKARVGAPFLWEIAKTFEAFYYEAASGNRIYKIIISVEQVLPTVNVFPFS